EGLLISTIGPISATVEKQAKRRTLYSPYSGAVVHRYVTAISAPNAKCRLMRCQSVVGRLRCGVSLVATIASRTRPAVSAVGSNKGTSETYCRSHSLMTGSIQNSAKDSHGCLTESATAIGTTTTAALIPGTIACESMLPVCRY